MRRRYRLLTLTALAASACSTAPPTDGADATNPGASESGGRFRGEFSVYAPFATQAEILKPGTYAGVIDQFRRGRVAIDFDSATIDDLAIALDDAAPEFPRGGGRFSFPPAEHNLPYTIAGEYFVEEAVLSSMPYIESCTELTSRLVCAETDPGNPTSSCELLWFEARGWQDMVAERVRRSEDLSVRFVDPETQALVAHYFGSNEPRVETSETPRGTCRISQ